MNRRIFAGRNEPFCHFGPIEVIPNLYCGSMKEALIMASEEIRVDTLVPLDSLGADIWGLGFRGEILYYPIEDYDILPDDVLDDLVSKILERLQNGKKVGVFCLGGHGRTGYVASVVLGRLGYGDPIGYLRSHYCRRAVESNAQIFQISEALEKPELVEEYAVQNRIEDFGHYSLMYDGLDMGYPKKGTGSGVCGKCLLRISGICQLYGQFVSEDEFACEDFWDKEQQGS